MRPTGFEPVASSFGGWRSIQLSYERTPRKNLAPKWRLFQGTNHARQPSIALLLSHYFHKQLCGVIQARVFLAIRHNWPQSL